MRFTTVLRQRAESLRLVRATNRERASTTARTPPARRRRPSESFWLHESGESETVCRRRRSGDRHGDSLDLARERAPLARRREPSEIGTREYEEMSSPTKVAPGRSFDALRPDDRSPERLHQSAQRPRGGGRKTDRRCCRPRTRAASECHLGRRGPRIPRGLGDD